MAVNFAVIRTSVVARKRGLISPVEYSIVAEQRHARPNLCPNCSPAQPFLSSRDSTSGICYLGPSVHATVTQTSPSAVSRQDNQHTPQRRPRSTSRTSTMSSSFASSDEPILTWSPPSGPSTNGTTAWRSTPAQNPATIPLNSPVCLKSGNALTSSSQAVPPASTRKSSP